LATYCFRCRNCGAVTTASTQSMGQYVCYCGSSWVRDYRAENVGVAVQMLKDEREAGGRAGYDNLFLPNNDDFKGKGDPDGTKGMRNWRETHQPKDTNHKPRWPGTVEKKVM